MTTTAEQLSAAATFAASWKLDLADEIAHRLSCYEVEDLALLLRTHGEVLSAEGWIAAHALHDLEGDNHYLPPTQGPPPSWSS